ncbi:PEP-CTERM-box response regulator transcription factor [Haloferula sp.]|uniref:PEP-CTERM-box response regulator transcription factor n=1 Tax=Haloferula sp. TaxID=2497595 RepID=UPI00329D76B2
MMNPKVLIVDDDEEIRTQMKWAISSDYNVLMAGARVEAMEIVRAERPEVVLLDLGLPPHPNDSTEGMRLLSAIQAFARETKVIIVSGQSERANAARAVGAGGYDFLCKPVDTTQLKMLIERCVYVSGLEREYREAEAAERPDLFEGMVGSSDAMQEVFTVIRKVATTPAPVLILGESGTGKEMVARAVHRCSPAKDRPFIAINCNAIPESLIESELFGHEKGAFTGAHTRREGMIESAAGGTLFLDEIGDLPSHVQVKLLRFLQERKIQRVGGREELDIDTRIVAATHVDLNEAIKGGEFREDLYFRLAVVLCRLPSLRDRGGDIMLLARDFLRGFATRNGRPDLIFDPGALRAISRYSWPGNVRELQNRVQRSVIMADGGRIKSSDLELDGLTSESSRTLKEAREKLEGNLVRNALERNDNKIAAAARDLGVSRPTFYELMNKLGISKS